MTFELAITSFHPGRAGGGVLIGRDEQDILRRAIVAVDVIPRSPEAGETWRITGPAFEHPLYGQQIHACAALPLMMTGSGIVRYLATNPKFTGVGWATAQRLWDSLGAGLYDALAARDHASLVPIVGPDRAVAIIAEFGLLSDEVEVFRGLDRYGVSPRTAGAAASLWGRGALERIRADPYALALLEPWRTVDERAIRMGVSPVDDRRLRAAVEEALARRYRLGHTVATAAQIAAIIPALLGSQASPVADDAVEASVASGRAVRLPGGLIQGGASWWMEREVEREILDRVARRTSRPLPAAVDAAIATVEARDGMVLSNSQREAVHAVVGAPLSILCGGAGTGKTTTLRTILDASERISGGDYHQVQIAVSGRAAKRMAEATGRQALTVARFMREIQLGRRTLRRGLLVVDESSMIDLPTAYRILRGIPQEVDVLFVGDPAQLPPIGPGLVFHRLVESGSVPCIELDLVRRQKADTGIPEAAREIREGRFPSLPRFELSNPLAQGVFLLPALGETETGRAALAVFCAMAGPPPRKGRAAALHAKDIQILCPTRRGLAGAGEINRQVEAIYMAEQASIHDWGLREGSKIVWLRNDYEKSPVLDGTGQPALDEAGRPIHAGFMNGALGTMRSIVEDGAQLELDDGAADIVREIDLQKLALGWAISIHKAQGSAFRRVVLPVTRSRLLDRAMIYTAVTRAIETVVLVGDPAVLAEAVAATPLAGRKMAAIRF